MGPTSRQDKAASFLALHGGDSAFVLPNAWDPGSARVLEDAGFEAIATTSAGISFSEGHPDDGSIGRDAMLARIAAITAAVDVPVTADIESGYSDETPGVAETIRGVIAAGAVGANLEDADRNGLFEVGHAAERVSAARTAADRECLPFTLNARIDSFLAAHPDPLEEAIARAARYVDAGADCVFVPGALDERMIATLVAEIDAPLNLVAGLAGEPLDLATYDRLGVRRISIGGSLARAGLGLVRKAAEQMRAGSFDFTAGAIPHADLNELMGS
ncbi:MAG TPA: isocitrate lyase/phosphoenolpyruvate mutase family protein [Solirubrobacterales bacterium]|nr:isocitrate lyase/phosphoenolpyruvate mutase family protein [Solirubrobacterales bacterium]